MKSYVFSRFDDNRFFDVNDQLIGFYHHFLSHCMREFIVTIMGFSFFNCERSLAYDGNCFAATV